jgi:putative glutamine amidotransferase
MASPRPPIVGIVCLDDRPRRDPHAPRFGQNQAYVHAVARAGAAPVLIPLLEDSALLRVLYQRLDGLLLPGGVDVDPAHYGEEIHEKCGEISPLRDQVELALIRWAVQDGKPMLAICRGIQVLNVALGGSLIQDIGACRPAAGEHDWGSRHPRDHIAHLANIRPGTRLAGLTGTASLPVNSMHHQALEDVAPGLTVSATAPDGIVEAVEMEGHPFCLAVQWHPEELAAHDPRAQALFDALVVACRTAPNAESGL